ncbi:MAG: efflux RND transporter periplasmic adaptor subunit [Gemmatimonadetes bacterium]|nr:efflux RND transporter periplasmic adaptor subunit [Gemmatimonadota bacterium]
MTSKYPLAFALAACVAAACAQSDAAQPATPPQPVSVARVTMAPAAPVIVATGTLGAKEELPLAFKVGGVVQRVRAEAGQGVRAGALLAELSQTEIGAEVEKARLGKAKAERDLARVKSLYRDSVATLEQMQDATTAFDVAQQNLRVAEYNRQYAVVRAPSDGVVLRRLVEAGQLVSPGAPVVLFRSDRRGVVLRAGLPDRDAVRVLVGDTAVVEFDAYPGERFTGRVSQVAASATSGTGTYEVEIALGDKARRLASGLVGRVTLAPPRAGLVPTVPVEAVLEAHGDSATLFEYAAGPATARRRRVHIGALEGSRVAVLGGLDTGATVIVAGGAWLRDGQKVTVTGLGTP